MAALAGSAGEGLVAADLAALISHRRRSVRNAHLRSNSTLSDSGSVHGAMSDAGSIQGGWPHHLVHYWQASVSRSPGTQQLQHVHFVSIGGLMDDHVQDALRPATAVTAHYCLEGIVMQGFAVQVTARCHSTLPTAQPALCSPRALPVASGRVWLPLTPLETKARMS